MKHLLLSLFAILLLSKTFSQNKDSIRFEKKIVSLEITLDSLEKELKAHKITESFYQTSLQNQTAIFSLITSISFILIGFISYNRITKEIKDQKKDNLRIINKHEENIIKLEKELITLKKSLHYEASNIAMLVAEKFEDEDPYTASKYSLRSAQQEIHSDDIKNVVMALNLSLGYLKRCNQETIKKDLKKENDFFYKILNEINASDDKKVKDLVAQYRVDLNKLMGE